MPKTMKSSTVKQVIVKLNGLTFNVKVDSNIFEDIYVEAATRVVESKKPDLSFFHKLRIVAECYEKKDEENLENHQQVNIYHALLNAGLFSIADLLREKTKVQHNIDLQKEPSRSNAGKSPSPK